MKNEKVKIEWDLDQLTSAKLLALLNTEIKESQNEHPMNTMKWEAI